MKTGKKAKERRYRSGVISWIKGNDVMLHVYISFAFLLVFTGLLIGIIFMQMYKKNYISSYTRLLTKQGKIISKKVTKFSGNGKQKQFEKYATYVDELERAEKTDVWILSKEDAKNPLPEEYVNAVVDENNVAECTMNVLNKMYREEKITANSEYDSTYGMTTLNVAVPIYEQGTEEVCGAVLLVSMLDQQTMGIREGKYLITLSILIGIVISYGVALWFSKYITKVISKLGRAISRLAKGDYSKISVKRPESQIGHLEKSLDYLAMQLRSAEKEREELEQVRADFFANVSHELRTPITVIRGYTETLTDGVITEQKQIELYHEKILHECNGIERLVEDLFLLSKMKNPDFHMDMEPVSLKQVFKDAIRAASKLGEEKKLQICMKAEEENAYLVWGDYGRLRQMFLIVLDNAVKFSKENGVVEIDIASEDDTYRVEVKDYGIGISKEQLPFIFEKFYTSKMRQNQKGTGLGLMIAGQIALRHDCEITVDSQEGVGSCFSFTLKQWKEQEEHQ